ncbi:MAG: hypothetical protein SFX74_08875 [Fimbriimonadaceae bacterium]|nr:hypothetical protein [Fimbriimonadaceae bacterium]
MLSPTQQLVTEELLDFVFAGEPTVSLTTALRRLESREPKKALELYRAIGASGLVTLGKGLRFERLGPCDQA